MPRKKEIPNYTTRRGNNEGTIYQRNDGRWCGQITIGYKADGKPERKTAYGKTRIEVIEKLAKFRCEWDKENIRAVNNTGSKSNFSFKVSNSAESIRDSYICDLILDWAFTFKVSQVGKRAFARYVGQINNHIIPIIGYLKPEEVTTNHIQTLLNEMTIKKSLSVDTANKVRQCLNQFFKYLVEDLEVLCKNPVTKSKINQNKQVIIECDEDETELADYKALPSEIRLPFLQALEKNEILKPIINTMIFAGLRIGEVLALKWKNIDFVKKCIYVRTATTVLPEVDRLGHIVHNRTVISNTKTSASVRVVPIPDVLFSILKQWQEIRQRLEYIKGNDFTSPKALVFSTNNGNLRTYSGIRSILKRFLKTYGFESYHIHFHMFRHTFATILFEEHVNPKVVQLLMGHKDIETTLAIYNSVSMPNFEDAVTKLDTNYILMIDYSKLNQLQANSHQSV